MKRTGIKRGTKPLVRRTPLKWQRSGRARPDVPMAAWCEFMAEGVCTGRATHRHHLIPRSQGGGDEAANTADVCAPCHRWAHNHPALSYERGWLRRRTA